jgi:hypothetical protein
MTNYIKSEIYRVVHNKDIYFFTAILAMLAVLLNGILVWFGKMDGETFPYDTTSFSYSNLVANPMVFCIMGTVVGVILYDGNKKNGNLKNTIAFGVSRTKVFLGECIVSSIAATVSLIIVVTIYIICAMLFLEQTGPVSLTDLLTEIPAVYLIAIACLISGIVCIEVCGKTSSGIIIWVTIWFIIPMVFFYLGLRIDMFYRIAMWMPTNFFGTHGMVVNMSRCITAWGTTDAMIRCISVGIVGVVAFSLVGVILLRKKEM